ncbi:MAG: hypothetical protein IJC52_04015 [Clostridia bacterium]|nr:hypothetical protein [Clostridia bacterium]
MKIQEAKLYNLNVPLMHPYQLSKEYGLVTDATIVVVELHTDNGLIGWGECDPWPAFTGDSSDSVMLLLKQTILPAVIGEDPCNIHKIHQIMDRCITGNHVAKSAVDMACHDLFGKAHNLPVHSLLGGKRRDEMPCFWSVGGGTPEQTVEAVLDVKKKGFRGCMLKIGGEDHKNDINRTLAAREAVGPDFPMVADANQGWDVDTAIAYGKAVENVGLLFIEQPVKAWDVKGMAQVRKKISTPLSADEGVVTIHDAVRLIEAQACDVFSVKVTKHGGIYPTKKICEYAAVNNIKVFFNSMHEEGITQAASLQVAATAEMLVPTIGHSFFSPMRLKRDITDFHTWTNNGMTAIPEKPGLGFIINEENLNHFTIETCTVTNK